MASAPPPPPVPPTPERPRFLRRTDDRVLGGVASGLARTLGVDPWVVRLGFLAATLFGGIAVAGYVAALLLIPEDRGDGLPAEQPPVDLKRGLLLAGALAVAVGAFGLLSDGLWDGDWWSLRRVVGVVAVGALAFAAFKAVEREEARAATEAPHAADPHAADPHAADPHAADPHAADPHAATADLRAVDAAGTDPTAVHDRTPGQRAADATTAAHRTMVRHSGSALRVAGVVLLSLALLCLAAVGFVLALWASLSGGGSIVAGVVIALGATAIVTSFFRPARWLAGVALVLAVPAAVVAAADIDVDGGIGQRTFRPEVPADLRAGGYELGAGELVLDLRDLEWPRAGLVRTRVELGVGHAVVYVPRGVCVRTSADVGAGYVGVLDDEQGGVDVDVELGTGRVGEAPRLELEAELGLGALEVVTRGAGVEGDAGDRPARDVDFDGTAAARCRDEGR